MSLRHDKQLVAANTKAADNCEIWFQRRQTPAAIQIEKKQSYFGFVFFWRRPGQFKRFTHKFQIRTVIYTKRTDWRSKPCRSFKVNNNNFKFYKLVVLLMGNRRQSFLKDVTGLAFFHRKETVVSSKNRFIPKAVRCSINQPIMKIKKRDFT